MDLNNILDYFNLKIPQEDCPIKKDLSLDFCYIDNKGNNKTESFSFIENSDNINDLIKEIKNKILINGGSSISAYQEESQYCEHAYGGNLEEKCRCNIKCGQYCDKFNRK